MHGEVVAVQDIMEVAEDQITELLVQAVVAAVLLIQPILQI
jgi:hypothetical protein